MGINRWIQSINSETLENILVDILVSDGTTYSGFINAVALQEDADHILLTSRPSKDGVFVGKKISKTEIIGFNFSTTARANFGVHHIRVDQNEKVIKFQHAIHDEQHFVLTGNMAGKDKFISECLSYLSKLSRDFLVNEMVVLALFGGSSYQDTVDHSSVDLKIREFLGA